MSSLSPPCASSLLAFLEFDAHALLVNASNAFPGMGVELIAASTISLFTSLTHSSSYPTAPTLKVVVGESARNMDGWHLDRSC
jgi:hypothetical protein